MTLEQAWKQYIDGDSGIEPVIEALVALDGPDCKPDDSDIAIVECAGKALRKAALQGLRPTEYLAKVVASVDTTDDDRALLFPLIKEEIAADKRLSEKQKKAVIQEYAL